MYIERSKKSSYFMRFETKSRLVKTANPADGGGIWDLGNRFGM